MQISFTNEVEGGREFTPIGRVQAASSWHGAAQPEGAQDHQKAALQALIEMAREFDADAIIGVDYGYDAVKLAELATVELRRVSATGIAVKLAKAAYSRSYCNEERETGRGDVPSPQFRAALKHAIAGQVCQMGTTRTSSLPVAPPAFVTPLRTQRKFIKPRSKLSPAGGEAAAAIRRRWRRPAQCRRPQSPRP